MQNYLNRLQGGVQTGMAGASGQAGALSNYLNLYGQARGIQGQSAAGKAVSQGNTWQNAISDIGKTIVFGPQGWTPPQEPKP
jgi:hypothetical protein